MSNDKLVEPDASRPRMPPEYPILGPTEGKGLLPWTWATERLSKSRGYFMATTRPDGRPHVMVVWGVWLQGKFYFSTNAGTRKARNLAANPRCVVCPERADEAVIVEGVAEEVTDVTVLKQFKEAYETKYQEEIETSQYIVYGVRANVVFGFTSNAIEFWGSATRWRFQEE
jgi:general stress protein 26